MGRSYENTHEKLSCTIGTLVRLYEMARGSSLLTLKPGRYTIAAVPHFLHGQFSRFKSVHTVKVLLKFHSKRSLKSVVASIGLGTNQQDMMEVHAL